MQKSSNAEILKTIVVAKEFNMLSLCDAVANRAKELWCVHEDRISNRHVTLRTLP